MLTRLQIIAAHADAVLLEHLSYGPSPHASADVGNAGAKVHLQLLPAVQLCLSHLQIPSFNFVSCTVLHG